MSVSDKARLLLTHNQTLVHRVSPDDYRANLVEMISIAREDNITVVLLTRPFIYDVPGQRENPDPYWWKTYGPLYNNITLSVGKEYNITVVDIYAYFDNKTEFFADESHFSEEGNRLAASIIAEEVKKIMEHETKNK
jgi:lysophospholipase L1-like esterase